MILLTLMMDHDTKLRARCRHPVSMNPNNNSGRLDVWNKIPCFTFKNGFIAETEKSRGNNNNEYKVEMNFH